MGKTNFLLPAILLVHLFLLASLSFTAWPEMTLWPYLTLAGWLPYRDIAMAHNPLLIFDLAIFYKIFGLSLLNLKIYTWILILITDLLIYWVAKKMTKNEKIALASLAFYVLWQPFFEGNGLWFDLALAPVALLIFYFFWKREFFWSGIFLGLAILIKQTAVWFVVPLIILMVSGMRGGHYRARNEGQFVPHASVMPDLSMPVSFVVFLLGLIIPLSFLISYLFISKTFADFYFWAVNFGIFYLPHAPGQVELPTLKQVFALAVPFAFILPALFLKKEKKLVLMLVIWCFFASLGVYPRWSLFHLQPALPFLAIISGLTLGNMCCAGRHKIFEERKGIFFVPHKNFRADLSTAGILIFLVLLSVGTFYFQARFYRLNWNQPPRFFEKETVETAEWLKNNTTIGEKIFILNSWDHLYALSNTLPATKPWVPTLPWYLEYPGIQEKMVENLAKEKPRIVVFEEYKKEGLGSYKPLEIDKFIKENYALKEIVAERFWILTPR